MKKILVVDDNREILNVLTILLETEGYLVKCKSSGSGILETVSRFSPDVVLLDIMLGNYDGRDICKDIKDNIDTTHIPIIMISASHQLYQMREKFCKAEEFITKPFDLDELLAKVQQYVG